MAIYHNHHHNYLDASRCYRIIWETAKNTKKMLPQKMDFGFSIDISDLLANYVGFLVLDPWSPENEAELQKLHENEEIQKNEPVYEVITNFLSREIIPTNIENYSLDNF